jgi:nitronate monooxygenase
MGLLPVLDAANINSSPVLNSGKKTWQQSAITKLFKIRYPIIQGPFGGGLSSVTLTGLVSNLGGLGSFGCQPLSAAEIVDTAEAIRKISSAPFNLNLWVSDRDANLDAFDEADYQQLLLLFKPYFDELKLPLPPRPTDLGPRFHDQIEGLLSAKPLVCSFAFGIPSADIISRCKTLGIKTIGAATTVDEAIAIEAAGMDAVIASGFEAGGHRVSFLRAPEDSLTGNFSLIPQIADAVKIPVIAAGGIADARGIKAALNLGADAVQMGTAFLATEQSNASKQHKEKIFSAEAKYTTLTKIFTGRLSRGIRNRITEELKNKAALMAPYPLQSKFFSYLNKANTGVGAIDALKPYWAGQSAPLVKHHDAAILFNSLVKAMDRF